MISAINGYNLNSFARGIKSQTSLSKTMSRLSSGLRINCAADSPAELGISESFRAKKSGINVTINNLKGGKDLLDTLDQSMDKMTDILKRLRDITLESANGNLTDLDRQNLQIEADQILSEVNRIAETTEFNSMSLLNGNIGINAHITNKSDTEMVKHLKITDTNAVDGEYKVKVLQNASTGSGSFIGKVLQPTDPVPGLNSSIGELIGSTTNGTVLTEISSGDRSIEVSLDTHDTIQESIDKINYSLKGDGIDASAYYVKPGVAGSTVTWDVSNIISEPIDITVPVVWDTSPFTDETLYDTVLSIDFTSDSTFTLSGNSTGVHGNFNVGNEVNSRGLHFNIAPDAGGHTYSAGDRIVIKAARANRTASITSDTIGITNIVPVGFISLADGSVKTINSSANPYQIKNISTAGIHGEAPPVTFSSSPTVNNVLNDTQITLTYTGSNTFNVAGNLTGNLGSGSGGSNFTSNDGALTFNINSDASFVAGDKIRLNATPATNASINGSNIVAFPMSILDGLNDTLSVSVDGTASEIDLTDGAEVFNNGSELATFVQNYINTDSIISGAGASVSVAFTSGHLNISSNSIGSAGSLQILSPSGASANATLGFTAGVSDTGSDATYNNHTIQQLPPVISGLSITANPLNTLKSEQFTLQLITDNNGADIWSVTGSVSGAHNNFVSGNPAYVSNSTANGGGGVKIALDPNSKFAVGDKIKFWSRNDGTLSLDPDSTPTSIYGSSNAIVTDDNGTSFRVYTGSDFTSGTAQIQIGSSGSSSVGTITYDTPAPSIDFTTEPELLPSNNILQDQVYTLTLIDDQDGADVWSVQGSLSGTHINYVSGTNYVSDNGSIGNGAGLTFEIDPDNRLHIGSSIQIGINTDKPRIEIMSNVPGSANGIDVSILSNNTDGLAAAAGSESYTIGNLKSGLTESSILATASDNPYDNIGIDTGNFIIQDKTGAIYTVSVNNNDRISDLVSKISALSPDIQATWDNNVRGINITDTSGGFENLKIFDVPGSTIAADLEIAGESSGGINGRPITRTDDYVLEITGPDGSKAIVTASSHNNNSVIKAGTEFNQAVKSTTNDNKFAAGGVLGVEIALNYKKINTNSQFSFTVSRGNLNLQAGDNQGDDNRLDLAVGGLTLSDLGFSSEPGSFDLTNQSSAQNIIDSELIDNALGKVMALRGQVGAFSNRIDHSTLLQSTYKMNITEAESRIRDIDYAAEIMELVKEKIILQSSTAMQSHLLDSERIFFNSIFK